MLQKQLNRLLAFSFLIIACMASFTAQAMTYDSPFWPLFRQPFFSFQEATFDYGLRAVFMSANKMSAQSIEESLMSGDDQALYRIFGAYDQAVLDRALREAGITQESVLRSDMRSLGELPWQSTGKITLNGGVIETFLRLSCNIGLGASLLLAKVNAHLELDPGFSRALAPGDAQELLLANKKMHDILMLTTPCYSGFTAGDVDVYLRLHAVRDYWHRIHHLDVGLNVGVLIPTAKQAPINNPAAISVGGNKHWGMYGEFEGRFILKDDLAIGLLFRITKRFARTSQQRMPFLTEPTNYGVLVGNARVNPGLTLVFEPRFEMTGLRDGLGVNVAYVLTHHFKDSWSDLRAVKTVPANLNLVEERSSWGSDYISVTALYDFGYDRENATVAPIFSLTVDIPFKGAVTKRVIKTTAISLRIESRL